MRDRFIKLLKDSSHYIKEQDSLIEKIADNFLANGVNVPPCKVGDTVYVVYAGGEFYWQAEVLAVWTRQDKDGTDITVTVKFKDNGIDTVHSEELHTTKEEAEQALRG